MQKHNNSQSLRKPSVIFFSSWVEVIKFSVIALTMKTPNYKDRFTADLGQRLLLITRYARDVTDMGVASRYLALLDSTLTELQKLTGVTTGETPGRAYRKPKLTREEYGRVRDTLTNEEILAEYRTSGPQVAAYRAWATRRGKKRKRK